MKIKIGIKNYALILQKHPILNLKIKTGMKLLNILKMKKLKYQPKKDLKLNQLLMKKMIKPIKYLMF